MIEHGNRAKAYLKAYPKSKRQSATNSGYRLMNDPLINKSVEEANAAVQNATIELKITEAKEKLQNYIGIRDTLGDIITGNKKFDKLYKVGDTVKPFTSGAEASEVLRALDINIKVLKMLPLEMSKEIERVFLVNEETGKITEVK